MSRSFGILLRAAFKNTCEDDGRMLDLALQHGIAVEISRVLEGDPWAERADGWRSRLVGLGLTTDEADGVIHTWGLALGTHPSVARPRPQTAAPGQLVTSSTQTHVRSLVLVTLVGLVGGAAPPLLQLMSKHDPHVVAPSGPPPAAQSVILQEQEYFYGLNDAPRPARRLSSLSSRELEVDARVYESETTLRVTWNSRRLRANKGLVLFYALLSGLGGALGGLLGFIFARGVPAVSGLLLLLFAVVGFGQGSLSGGYVVIMLGCLAMVLGGSLWRSWPQQPNDFARTLQTLLGMGAACVGATSGASAALDYNLVLVNLDHPVVMLVFPLVWGWCVTGWGANLGLQTSLLLLPFIVGLIIAGVKILLEL